MKRIIKNIFLLLFCCLLLVHKSIAFVPAFEKERIIRETAQMLFCSAKTIALLITDFADTTNVATKKKLALLRVMARVANGIAKSLDTKYVRGKVSKTLHLNAMCWQVVRDVEEYGFLSRAVEKNGKVPSFITERYYKSKEHRAAHSWNKFFRPLYRLIEWAAALGLAFGVGKREAWLMVQAASDLLIRFWENDGEYIPTPWLGKVESAASVLPSVWDIGGAVYDWGFRSPPQQPHWDEVCSGCGRCYGERNGLVCQMNTCGHWCCYQCANQKRIPGKRYRSINGHGAVTEGEVATKNSTTCPICDKADQGFKSINITRPDVSAEEPGEKCPICLGSHEKNVMLPCGHTIGDTCFSNLIKQQKSITVCGIRGKISVNTCPECRECFIKRQLRKWRRFQQDFDQDPTGATYKEIK